MRQKAGGWADDFLLTEPSIAGRGCQMRAAAGWMSDKHCSKCIAAQSPENGHAVCARCKKATDPNRFAGCSAGCSETTFFNAAGEP